MCERLRAPLLESIRSLGPPEPLLVGPRRGRHDPAEPLDWRFVVHGREVQLAPPIEWGQDPYRDRSWQYALHTLQWLRPLLDDHEAERGSVALSAALAVVLDWTAAHLSEPGTTSPSEFAWYDMAVGIRAPYIAYVLRAALCESCIEPADAQLLLASAERHGLELADPAKYAAGHNHGLFQDEGLYLLAHQLPVLPEAETWQDLALERLWATLNRTVDVEEGSHLEHSSAYQFTLCNMLRRLAQHIDMPELHQLLDRMQSVAAWHVTPTNKLVQLGDTDEQEAPAWASRTASSLDGMKTLFGAGQAIVRKGDSYLMVSAAYHSAAHKQADDASLFLMEKRRVILGDAGRWGYYERELDRIYARSARAHNALVIDGLEADLSAREPYGSGLIATGHAEGWYAILVSNPLLAAEGVAHNRLVVYCPGSTLLVRDDVLADNTHRYVRYFHLGDSLEARLSGSDIHMCAPLNGKPAVIGTLRDDSEGVSITLVKGRDQPSRLGWAYPGDRTRRPVWTAAMSARARSTSFISTISLGSEPVPPLAAHVDSGGCAVLASRSGAIIEIPLVGAYGRLDEGGMGERES